MRTETSSRFTGTIMRVANAARAKSDDEDDSRYRRDALEMDPLS